MKKNLIFTLLCLSGTALFATSIPSVHVTSRIDRVTVYPDSAKVNRSFSGSVKAGESLIVLDYLPNGMDTANIKIELLSSSVDAVVRDMTFSQNAVPVESHPDALKLRDDRDRVQGELTDIQGQIDLLQSRRAYGKSLIDSFTKGYGTKEGMVADKAAVEETWAFYEKTYWEVDSKIKILEERKKPIQEAIKEIEKAYSELMQNLQRSTQRISILVEASAPAEVEFGLSYLVRNCSWAPVYEIRAYPGEEKVTVRYQVSVYQYSGENWERVQLTLSSAQAGASSHIPTVYPITLNKIEPMMMRKTSSRKMEMEEDAMVYTMAAPAPVMEMEAPTFAANYSSYQVTLPQSFSMKSGQDRKKSLIDEVKVAGDFWTVVAPKYDAQAYLAAEVKNPFEMPILPGESVLFVDDQLVGHSYVSETPMGEVIELSLGLNENIKVERESGKQNEEDRGIFGKRTRLSRQYFTEVANHSDHSQRIVVKDQFPLSQNEKIEVNRIEPASGAVEVDENTGLFSWDFELEPKAVRKLETRFEVVYPEDWVIPQSF